MKTLDWYFDFLSPFAYLSLGRVEQLSATVAIRYRPVLFAGLLQHWGNKGPAELAPKRLWTYRWCTWKAKRDGITFRFPSAHPFNPLPYLRLSIAAGNTPAAVRAIFDALWTTGVDPADEGRQIRLAKAIGIDPDLAGSQAVKDTLRLTTAEAAALGVFGVPTLAVDGELFWGVDGMDFAQAFLADPELLAGQEMRRVSDLPIGVMRNLQG